MKHSLKYLAASVGAGLLLLVACEKADVKLSQPGPTSTLTQTVTQEDADAAFARLRQPNGKPISKHLAALEAWRIDGTNRYQRFWNKMTREQEQAELAKIATLQQQPQTAETQAEMLRLSGYKDAQEYQAEIAKYTTDKALLEQEDPGFDQLSPQEKQAVRKIISDHFRRFRLHQTLMPTNAKSSAASGKAPTSTTNEDSPDDPWYGPDPVGEGPCMMGWLACKDAADVSLAAAVDLCGPVGSHMFTACQVLARSAHRRAMSACEDELNECWARQ